MFWYVMLMLLSPLYLLFGLVFRSEQARLVLAPARPLGAPRPAPRAVDNGRRTEPYRRASNLRNSLRSRA